MGWYYYLEDKPNFPFTAICNEKRAISPLLVKDEVDIIGMAPEEECEREMFVIMRWERDGFKGSVTVPSANKSETCEKP